MIDLLYILKRGLSGIDECLNVECDKEKLLSVVFRFLVGVVEYLVLLILMENFGGGWGGGGGIERGREGEKE